MICVKFPAVCKVDENSRVKALAVPTRATAAIVARRVIIVR